MAAAAPPKPVDVKDGPATDKPPRPPMSPNTTATIETAATTVIEPSADGFAHGSSEEGEDNGRGSAIRVIVRCRPFLPFEKGNAKVVHILPNDQIRIQPPNASSLDSARYTFTFDAAYPLETTQNQVFKRSIKPLVNACLEGYNATVLAYGQTGSGKTHSILGQTNESRADIAPEDDMSEAGVIPRALRALFYCLGQAKEATKDNEKMKFDFNVKVQFLELYGEDIRDLLNPDPDRAKLSIRDGRAGVEPEVIGIKEIPVETADDALLCLTRGSLRRVTRATAMNSESSRSHAIMSVIISQNVTHFIENPNSTKPTEEKSARNSKFHFVDLAGSERIKRTGASGQGVKEGININKGLLVLGNVISALATQAGSGKKESFVPYRDSKLTRLLKGSLGGNHKTLMVACCSPSGSNTEETINTLRYANRAKNIQNKAVVNMDAGSKLIAELRGQLKVMATEYLLVRSFVDESVQLDNAKTIFTQEVLTTLAGGGEVKINVENPKKKPILKKGVSSGTSPATEASTSSTTPSTPPSSRPSTTGSKSKPSAGSTAPTASTSSSSGSKGAASPSAGKSSSSKDATGALDEIKKLRRALEKSDDRVLESERQLEWIKEELRVSREEVLALAAVDKSTDGDSASNVSALTEDFGEMPRLSQDTYETVKSIYEEKLIQMTFELKEREDERDNIAMTLYRHESDSQRLFYVKNTLNEDLSRKEEQIASLKQELREMANLTVVANASPQAERQFRRLRGRANKRLAKNATASMSAYYTEKLNKIERHIKLREEECLNLGKELEKLEADSQIFTDLAKDLSERLNAKESEMQDLKGKTKDQLKKLGVVIEKDQEERDQLVAELTRLKDDSETFSALVKALTEERKTKLEHVEKYKKRHREMATSIGLTSPYVDTGMSSGDDIDDDASVSSTWSLMSIDTVATSASNPYSGTAPGTIAKIDYDQKISQLEANITKHEEDRIFILNDLEKLEADTHAFTELSNSLKQKLRMKEDQIAKLKTELDEFTQRLKNQEKELMNLTKEDTKSPTKEDKSGDVVYMNGRGEDVDIR